MSSTQERYKIWVVSTTLHPRYLKHFEKHPEHKKHIEEFETDVTTDPFYHSGKKRIVKLQSEKRRYPKGSYRWRKSNLRIAYFPDKENRTVYPLDAYTAGRAIYKRRS